ncbi:thiamine biosynthesis lipoprotein [Acetitomaculum ruminis DSM 5522]|uniref:FAD:protein FMN transferase n=1 Tax=Acetitomaculum ruminis DSM 5522 TaxID=1120918 RepID=A0A1I0YHS2_9FIRM|nr:FAD:protein FMN transferase [Acetitomaculum ruminis]SFB12702.1 thiamine biosynthesis lipoprotein [Acetitomaculum ruminis DSM 5522]
MKKLLYLLIILVCLTVSGCSLNGQKEKNSEGSVSDNVNKSQNDDSNENDTQPVSQEIFAMDTYMTVTAYGKNAKKAVDDAAKEIERLDKLLSTGSDDSEIAKINKNSKGVVSDDTAYLLNYSLELYKMTNHIFDISIYPVMCEWGFPTKDFKVPDKDTLNNLLNLVDASSINFDSESNTLSFAKENMEIDLGGIAKGYTSGRIMQIFKEDGVESGLVSLGGNVHLCGKKTDGSNWRVGIENPSKDGSYLGVLEAADTAVITSGGYERYFEKDGVVYHHIIDPATGYPANSGLTSVSIISRDGTLADGLSTSVFIMGLDKGIEFWKEHKNDFDMVLFTDDKKLYVTEPIADAFTSDFEINVIKAD